MSSNPSGGVNIFGQQPAAPGEALKQYSTDLTQLALDGKLDPVIGRHDEIRRTLQSKFFNPSDLYNFIRSLGPKLNYFCMFQFLHDERKIIPY